MRVSSCFSPSGLASGAGGSLGLFPFSGESVLTGGCFFSGAGSGGSCARAKPIMPKSPMVKQRFAPQRYQAFRPFMDLLPIEAGPALKAEQSVLTDLKIRFRLRSGLRRFPCDEFPCVLFHLQGFQRLGGDCCNWNSSTCRRHRR